MKTAAQSRRTTQVRRSERTRERILEAATEEFANHGFHGTRVADIAERAGIAYGLVYHHYRNKEEILAAIFSQRWGQYVAYIDEVAQQPLTFRQRMGKLVHFWVETYRQEPSLITVMINEISRSYEFIESHDIATVLTAFDAIEKIIEKGQAAGEARTDIDSRLATYAVLGVAEMVLTGYVMGALKRDRAGFGRDEEQLLALMLDGLATD